MEVALITGKQQLIASHKQAAYKVPTFYFPNFSLSNSIPNRYLYTTIIRLMKKLLPIIIIIAVVSVVANIANSQTAGSGQPSITADTIRAKSLHDSATARYNTGNYRRALSFEKEAALLWGNAVGKNNVTYGIFADTIYRIYSLSNNIDSAIAYSRQAAESYANSVGKMNTRYASALGNLAWYYSQAKNYDKSLEINNEVLKIYEQLNEKQGNNINLLNYSITLANQANNYYYMNEPDSAIKLLTKAAQIRGDSLGKKDRGYANYLYMIIGLNQWLENWKEVANLGPEAIDAWKKNYGDSTANYIYLLDQTAFACNQTGQHKEAVRLGNMALSANKNTDGDNHYNDAYLLDRLAMYLYIYGDFTAAKNTVIQALETEKQANGETNSYAVYLCDLAEYTYRLGDINNAIKTSLQGLELMKKLYGDSTSQYARYNNNLANYYKGKGEHGEALKIYLQSLKILEKHLGRNHPDYALVLSNVATEYSYLGACAEAIALNEKVLDIYESSLGEEHPEYSRVLGNIADEYTTYGDYEKALELSKKTLEIKEKTIGKEHPDYAFALINLGRVYSFLSKDEKALKIDKEALRITESTLGKHHYEYAKRLENIGWDNYLLKNYKEAIKFATQGLVLKKEIFGDDNYSEQLEPLRLLFYCYLYENNNTNTQRTAIERSNKLSNIVLTTFRDLTNNGRTTFWNKHKEWFESNLPFITVFLQTDSLVSAMYDGALLSKGILLNSDIEMSRLLLESGDTAIVALYDGMLANRAFAGKQRENLAMRTDMDDSLRMSARRLADSLERAANRQERELVERSKAFGDYTKNLAVGWRDVQSRLSDDDIAIEFLEIPLSGDSAIYAAMTLRRGYDCPRFTRLFEKHQLTGLDRSLLFSSPALYDLVWKPLEEELSGMKNVYFSPAGELHRTAIEYAPVSEDTIFSDRYNAFRLSSTRQLAVTGDNGNDVDGEGAVLYGGLRYNARPSVIAADSRKYAASDDGTRSAPVMPELAADSLIARGTRIAELPATKVEVDSIGTMMRGRSVDVSLFTDTTGTEASFKALSGQRRGIIHIATHGFFGKNDPADNALATPDAGRTTRHTEDKAMTRSGLLFAGAANAWQMPDTVDNGILTAQEVSALDLRGLDLCVLSACETGLGEITGEGVFGLQRGFKKAGAGTLMVSLRPVYDKATGLLMTEFYRNLLAGKSKTASLKAAQQYLRSYEEPATEDAAQTQGGAGRAGKFAKARQQSAAATTNAPTATVKPYADPVYWAYFILVDAL